MSNGRLKLAKDQANAKQHPEAEFLLFENCSLSSFTLSSFSWTFCSGVIVTYLVVGMYFHGDIISP